MRRAIFALILTFALLPTPAYAHTASITCTSVSFAKFPSGSNAATITVNGTAHPVTWTGTSAAFDIRAWYSSNPVTVRVVWSADGGGDQRATLTCDVPVTTTKPPVTTTTVPTTTTLPPIMPVPVTVVPKLTG